MQIFKFLNKTAVAGVPKIRWECPKCSHRFNTIPESSGLKKICSKCGMDGFLGEDDQP